MQGVSYVGGLWSKSSANAGSFFLSTAVGSRGLLISILQVRKLGREVRDLASITELIKS